MSDTASSLFTHGDRVLIVGAHPWNGYTGKIIGPWPTRDMDWLVELDNGQQIGASEVFHLQKVIQS